MPRPALPSPAAVLPGEADILAGVVADPADFTAKLVYADWLEERDDPRGPFLRAFVIAARAGKPLPASGALPRTWRDLVGVTVVEAARAHGLDDGHTDALLRLAFPSLSFQPARRKAAGASRYGGLPDLPPGVGWPYRTNGNPLSFLCQIDLADLAASAAARDLPAAGVLSAFYYLHDNDSDVYQSFDRMREEDGWRLFHFPPGTELRPCDYPDDFRAANRFRPLPIAFAEHLELPIDWTGWKDLLPLGPDEWSRYSDLWEAVTDPEAPGDRLLGHVRVEEWHGAFGRAGRTLLSVGLGGSQGLWDDFLMRLHFTIAAADLRAGRLDRVVLEPEWLSS